MLILKVVLKLIKLGVDINELSNKSEEIYKKW